MEARSGLQSVERETYNCEGALKWSANVVLDHGIHSQSS
jgi:hypothetical protein